MYAFIGMPKTNMHRSSEALTPRSRNNRDLLKENLVYNLVYKRGFDGSFSGSGSVKEKKPANQASWSWTRATRHLRSCS